MEAVTSNSSGMLESFHNYLAVFTVQQKHVLQMYSPDETTKKYHMAQTLAISYST